MLTQERLKELLHYDPLSGVFTWRVNKGPARAGAVAGGTNGGGYVTIAVDGISHRAHRLAWLYVYGTMPRHQVDHIDGVRDNNRIANLRDVTPRLNQQNRKAHSNNGTGLLGATWHKASKKFQALIRLPNPRGGAGKLVHLGLFATAEAAHQAYLEAKRVVHVGCTI